MNNKKLKLIFVTDKRTRNDIDPIGDETESLMAADPEHSQASILKQSSDDAATIVRLTEALERIFPEILASQECDNSVPHSVWQ